MSSQSTISGSAENDTPLAPGAKFRFLRKNIPFTSITPKFALALKCPGGKVERDYVGGGSVVVNVPCEGSFIVHRSWIEPETV